MAVINEAGGGNDGAAEGGTKTVVTFLVVYTMHMHIHPVSNASIHSSIGLYFRPFFRQFILPPPTPSP